jgi:CPA1 family monovalent cation:H+ antiporter
MQGGTIHAVELVFLLLLLFVVAFGALANKLKLPYPIVLVIAGLILSFIPGIPRIHMNPDLIFFVFLPPLLYAGAWFTPWREFSYNIVSILLLAFGLVAFTVLGVAGTAHLIFNGFNWELGFVLGAVVATTDAIAATSIAKRVGLPKRIVDILEGESLVNDATGLLALEFGVAMVVQGENPTLLSGSIRLTYLIGAGIVIGILLGFLVERIERYLDDGPIEICISLMVPYIAYLAAEHVHASGVLAVVACGLLLSRRSSKMFSANVRLQAFAFWNAITFAMNGLVFVLIGLQLPFVLAGINEHRLPRLLLYGALFSALVILLRLIWTFPGAYLAYAIRVHIFHQHEARPAVRGIFVVGWTGMRGVIALAAALSLPEILADGSPFPHRNLIIFLTFAVILVTLVFQGLTLAPLIRVLGLAGTQETDPEELDARRTILETALQHIQGRRSTEENHHLAAAFDNVTFRYQTRLAALNQKSSADGSVDELDHAQLTDLTLQLLRLERDTAENLRNEGRISDDLLRRIERELDLSETRLNAISS